MMVDVNLIYYLLYGIPALFTVGTILFVIGIQVRGFFSDKKQKKMIKKQIPQPMGNIAMRKIWVKR